ncbi:hypothetical protein NO1_0873 [Candidatus Termititenax aidoneus]|uniref:Uncharacterized protein n=1 Tax=Termititenax aidoneus TaxID=2218524 RepID=A0A388TA13_TERA1|nr:hypothetical protein NO1_0873 [Candidatus Termititenax aidoneus]
MMMHRKIVEMKDKALQIGQSRMEQELIVPRANSLNNALLEMAEILNSILPLQEQTLEILNAKKEIFKAAQGIVAEGSVELLLGQIPEETKEYLQAALGLEWDKAGEYLTAENLETAIRQIERQQAQLLIVSKNNYRETLETLQKYLPPLQDQAAELSEDVKKFRDEIELQASRAYISQEIAVSSLLKLSAQALPERQKYFIELTPGLEKILPVENLPVIIYQNQKYLVCQNQDDRQLFNQAIVRAYLNAYENILINDVLHYNEPGKGVAGQEQNDLLINANATRKTLAVNDSYRQIKLFKELALLKYKYQDPGWQYYQTEAQKILAALKNSFSKKAFAELENELNTEIKTWAANNGLEYNLPALETAEEKRRAGILPQIDFDALKNSLQGLAGNPRFKLVLAALLALFLLIGGTVTLGPSFKRKFEEMFSDKETSAAATARQELFERIYQEIADKLRALVDGVKSGQKTPQEAAETVRQAFADAIAELGPDSPEAEHLRNYVNILDAWGAGAQKAADPDQTNDAKIEALDEAMENIRRTAADMQNDAVTTKKENEEIVVPLSSSAISDLEERKTEIVSGEAERARLEAEKEQAEAARLAEEKEKAAAAERAKAAAAQENELAELLNNIKTAYDTNALIFRNVIRYSSAYTESDVELAKAYQALATKPAEYFSTHKMSALSAKIAEVRDKAAKIDSFIRSVNPNLERLSQ